MSQLEEEKTITLIKPITIGKGDSSITYTEIHLREPDAGEIEKASRADTQIGVVINMVHLIAKIPRAAAEKLCQRDISQASEYLSVFSDAGPVAAVAGQN